MTDFSRRRPSPEALAWAGRALGRGFRVVAWRRMTGGITSAVHRLTAEHDGFRQVVVLRQFERGQDERGQDERGQDERAAADGTRELIEREGRTLRRARAAGLAAPELLAACPGGEDSGGHPSILMTRLPGHIDLTPADPDCWLRQIAVTAARIHDARVEAPAFERWIDPALLAAPESSSAPALWRSVISVLRENTGSPETCFIHRDFQHFNFLWARGRVTGVVDWGSAAAGPPAIDVGHCRLNLAVLFGAAWAEQFRLAYEAETGRGVDPWWDLHALASYGDAWRRFIPRQVGGRAAVDIGGMTARVEEVMRGTLDRI